MKLQIRQKFAFGFAALALVTTANAAVTFAGSILNNASSEVSSWSSTSAAKTLDIDGNNYYGSDGYAWMNNIDADGEPKTVDFGLVQAAPGYFTSGIFYNGTGSGVSGSFSGAGDRLDPTGVTPTNVGYAGANYDGTTGATTLQNLFVYTMNRDMLAGETIRVGVVLDSLDAGVVGADFLSLSAGGVAAASGLNRNSSLDMYFFDVTGLVSGDTIQILGAKAADSSGFGYNAVTIGGVTFDSVPEPSSALLGGLGLLAMLRRRR